jgi:hypothetical protein
VKPGDVILNARCEECNDLIRIAVVCNSERVLCKRCVTKMPSFYGNINPDNSPSTDGWWDLAVRVHEG